MKKFDDKKFKFYMKYLIPQGKLQEFNQKLDNLTLAMKINPELVFKAKEQLIKEYPFTKEFLE